MAGAITAKSLGLTLARLLWGLVSVSPSWRRYSGRMNPQVASRLYRNTDQRRRTLHQAHETARAKFGDFAGWSMPLFAGGGVIAEHSTVHATL